MTKIAQLMGIMAIMMIGFAATAQADTVKVTATPDELAQVCGTVDLADESITGEAIDALMAAGFYGDPVDHDERLYSPACGGLTDDDSPADADSPADTDSPAEPTQPLLNTKCNLPATAVSNLEDTIRFRYVDQCGRPSLPAGFKWAEDDSIIKDPALFKIAHPFAKPPPANVPARSVNSPTCYNPAGEFQSTDACVGY